MPAKGRVPSKGWARGGGARAKVGLRAVCAFCCRWVLLMLWCSATRCGAVVVVVVVPRFGSCAGRRARRGKALDARHFGKTYTSTSTNNQQKSTEQQQPTLPSRRTSARRHHASGGLRAILLCSALCTQMPVSWHPVLQSSPLPRAQHQHACTTRLRLAGLTRSFPRPLHSARVTLSSPEDTASVRTSSSSPAEGRTGVGNGGRRKGGRQGKAPPPFRPFALRPYRLRIF